MSYIDLRPEDIIHKSHLHRLLMEIVDQPYMSQSLAFKGGTCAAMLGYLDRFSIDLDFDVLVGTDEGKLRQGFHKAFDTLGFEVKVAFDKILFFQLKYQNEPGRRNSLTVSATTERTLANQFRVAYFPEIDRMINSQTIETMFANKLVAVMDRYARHQTIAGRDIYDVHHFLIRGFDYHVGVIHERTGLEPGDFFRQLIAFVKTHINQKTINEDLNSLLPNKQFQKIRKVLIPETLSLLERELRKTGEDLEREE
jgi:predicted nucleotidyltransferase component of viral defense system